MARVILLLAPEALSDYRGSLLDEGHEVTVVAPEQGSIQALLALGPELIVAAASAVTAEAIADCDEQGVQLLVIADGVIEREAVIRLGLYEVADRGAPWQQLRSLLGWGGAGGAPAHGRPTGAERSEYSERSAERGFTASSRSAARGSAPSRSTSSKRRPGRSRRGLSPDRAVEGRLGRAIGVWGPAGAPGRSTVAVNLAAELAELGSATVLVDADSYAASVAPMLALTDEAPGFAAACRLVDYGELNPAELQRVSQETGRTPFRVLSGIGNPSRWTELSAKRVAAVLQACRRWMDTTVIDTGFSLEQDEELSSEVYAPRRNAAALTSVREADHLVVVASGEPVGISRLLRNYGELLEQREAETITVVVNRFRSGPIGMGARAQIDRTLQRFGGIDHAVYLPYDRIACDAALLAGRPLAEAARRSGLRHELAALARRLQAPASAAPERFGDEGPAGLPGAGSSGRRGRGLGRAARAALS